MGTVHSDLLTQRDGERWSIQENIGHLLDLEPVWLGRVNNILSGEDGLRAVNLTNRKTFEPQHSRESIATILPSFRQVRMSLVSKLESLDERAVILSALHPPWCNQCDYWTSLTS